MGTSIPATCIIWNENLPRSVGRKVLSSLVTVVVCMCCEFLSSECDL